MKKAVSLLMCFALVICSVFAITGCSKQGEINTDIVLITDGGTVNDGAYNKSAWEGIKQFATENGYTYHYYQPALTDGALSVDAIAGYIDLAVDNGAQFIILPGESFAVSAYEIAPQYPDVKFVLVDATPHSEGDTVDRYIPNVMSVTFDACQSGFLAGYISVITGNTELGYLGQYASKTSANYGAGFVQGAAYAADSLKIPVTVDWADYDSPLIDYNYSIKLTAVYNKVEDAKKDTFKVVVENGTGSGVYTDGSNVTITAAPAPEGQTFDRWEVKSNSDGVSDKKVNISSATKSPMNLLVEKCDCTITAVYKEIDGATVPVKVMSADGTGVEALYSVAINDCCSITAPIAPINMVFDHWESSIPETVEDINSRETRVNVTDKEITVKPVYVESDIPTFNLTVVTGEGGKGESSGSGSYLAGDRVTVAAAVPEDGYMFSHWENEDVNGNGTGLAMENEYYWNTSFEMVDRYASVVEAMYDKGVTMMFAGGNDRYESVYTAKGNFTFDLGAIASGSDHKNSYSAIIKNYGEAVKDCLADYRGGSVATANCATDGIYATYVSEDEKVVEQYNEIYKALAEKQIELIYAQGGASYEFCQVFNESDISKCLTLKGWFLSPILD